MPSATLLDANLANALQGLDDTLLPAAQRRAALDVFLTTPSGRQKPSRFWRVDLDTLAPAAERIARDGTVATIEHASPRAIVCDLATAAREHADLLRRAFGATGAAGTKFGALAHAFASSGAFVYVPADCDAGDPIEITYRVTPDTAIFPYTVVVLERGARATIVERFAGGGADSFACAVLEAVTGESAQLTLACEQTLESGTQFIYTRVARPGSDATVAMAAADLGAELVVGEVTVAIERAGIDAAIASLFFPTGTQHVDIVSTVEHVAGDATSNTQVKSAATGLGQARYLGNIRIAPGAQGSDASLRDDALLLSKRAHIDSIPALEIGANEVKAYHGATVGALDEEQIFYLQTRGIDRTSAERTIALGFFEPAIGLFPTQALRDRIREAVAEKLS